MARDRAAQFRSEQIEDGLLRRLRALRDRGDFAGVHISPADSSDVSDEQACRLVVLGPRAPFTKADGGSPAHAAAQEILDGRGNTPRKYRNKLMFLAPDRDRLLELEQSVREWMAWTSIWDDRERLNLDTLRSDWPTEVRRMLMTRSSRAEVRLIPWRWSHIKRARA